MFRFLKAFASFAIHSFLAVLLGGIFGFFFTAKFSPNVPLNSADYPSDWALLGFFNSSNSKSAEFSPTSVSAYIKDAIFEDFKLKNKAHGTSLQTPHISLDGKGIVADIDISAPILGASSIKKLSFRAVERGGALALSGASLGEARIPLFIAGAILNNLKVSYSDGPNSALAIKNLENLKILKIGDSVISVSK